MFGLGEGVHGCGDDGRTYIGGEVGANTIPFPFAARAARCHRGTSLRLSGIEKSMESRVSTEYPGGTGRLDSGELRVNCNWE